MCFAGEFSLQFLSRAACAGTMRATGLRHKTVNHPMEDDPIIKAVPCQLLDTGNMVRRQIRAHFDDNAAILQLEIQGIFRIACHIFSPSCRETYPRDF